MQKSKIEWMPENPYPEKIFPDLDAESQSAVNFVISGLGLTPDRVFGSWGRQVWDSLCREMERRGEAAKEIGLQQSEGELVKNSVMVKLPSEDELKVLLLKAHDNAIMTTFPHKTTMAHELLRLLGEVKP